MDIIELLERRDEAGIELLKSHYSEYCYTIRFGHLRSPNECYDRAFRGGYGTDL